MKTKILSKLQVNTRFSISLDEWTDFVNRRYLLVNMHDLKEIYNLGLIQIPSGHCDAETINDQVEIKLKDIGINFEHHIVGSTSDGATVMKKYGNNCKIKGGTIIQYCINHAIQLAIVGMLYEKKKKICKF